MYKIDRISPSGSGDRLLLRIVSEGGEVETVPISCEQYRELGIKKGELSEDTYREITSVSEYEEALARGMRILGYGANSKKQLRIKLCHSGISGGIAGRVSNELERRGYINEGNDAARLSEGLMKKGYGKRRIISVLRSKGFSESAIEEVEESLGNVDFTELCTDVARKKFKGLKNDRDEIRKAIAKLINLGYNVTEAKQALESVLSRSE